MPCAAGRHDSTVRMTVRMTTRVVSVAADIWGGIRVGDARDGCAIAASMYVAPREKPEKNWCEGTLNPKP